MRHSSLYTLVFAAVVCLVCSILVSASAVALRPRQQQNMVLDRQAKILIVAGLADEKETADPDRVKEIYGNSVRPRLIDRETGEYAENEEELLQTYDMQKAMQVPETSIAVAVNPAQVQRTPLIAQVYEIINDAGEVETVVVPVQGKGLWSTLFGYLALKSDVTTIQGITFYQHAETPGLGGEIDNPKWKGYWPGRRAFDDDWKVQIHVGKGPAGPPEEDPYRVDGLSGATITSRGVTSLLEFWLGPEGYLPYLQRFRGIETPQTPTT
jgi:Na+-transporting NADH:ubiquinone oxidoreductase subunit C